MSRMLLSPGRSIQGAGAIKVVQDFFYSVGLPLCLEDLDIAVPPAGDSRQVSEAAVAEGETIHSTWFLVVPDMATAAIWTADALGTSYKTTSRC